MIVRKVRLLQASHEIICASSEGCSSHPQICTDKNEIERLQPLIDSLIQQYDTNYTNSQIEYIDMRDSLYKYDVTSFS